MDANSGDGGGGDGGSGGGMGGTGGSTSTLPQLDVLEPDHGTMGQRPVFFVGENFATDGADLRVFFNGLESIVYSVDEQGTRIETAVPTGATTGMVWVLSDGVRVNGPTFTVEEGNPLPRVTSMTPARIELGSAEKVRLAGTGFVADSRVTVNGLPTTSRTLSPTSLEFSLPILEETAAAAVVVSNPAPGGGSSEPATLLVYKDYGLLSVVDLDGERVLLAFSEPPSPSLAVDVRMYAVEGPAGAATVSSAIRPSSNPRHVELRLATRLVDDAEFEVDVRPELESEFSGHLAYGWTTARFRSGASFPGAIRSSGGSGCGKGTLSRPGGIGRAPPDPGNLESASNRVFILERSGHQVEVGTSNAGLLGFLGWDGSSSVVHAPEAAAVGCPGELGSSEVGGLSGPRGAPIFLWPEATLVVGDTGNGRLQTFVLPSPYEPFRTGARSRHEPRLPGASGQRGRLAAGCRRLR